jgi:3-methylfumaryl-CoA hydratase
MSLLTDEHLAWIGREDEPVTIEVSRRDIQKYAAATEQRLDRYISGDEAPPMFIFNLFGEIAPLAALQNDGLNRHTISGPRLPLERTMAGGTHIQQYRPIRAGDVLVGRRKIVDIYEKQGSTGPLIFTVRKLAICTEAGEPVIDETQTSIAR